MTRWCGSVKPQGSRSLRTGGWKMERTWSRQRWDLPSASMFLEIEDNTLLPRIDLQQQQLWHRCSSRTCCCWMKNVSNHVLYFQSFIVLFVQALLANYHTLLSSSLQHSASCAAIHYVIHFRRTVFIWKELDCVDCGGRLNCKQAKCFFFFFMLVCRAQWCKSCSNLLLNLSSPSALVKPAPPKTKMQDSLYKHWIPCFHLSSLTSLNPYYGCSDDRWVYFFLSDNTNF